MFATGKMKVGEPKNVLRPTWIHVHCEPRQYEDPKSKLPGWEREMKVEGRKGCLRIRKAPNI